MNFEESKLPGVFQIDLDIKRDERGFFARTWCQNEFAAHGLNARVAQCNTSYNKQKGTLRGIHYQIAPFAEAKVVRCVRGSIYDVVVDLRRESNTFGQWIGVVLTAENRKAVYVPEGCGHGFLTLEDDAEIFYLMSEFYNPDCARGVRWNDPQFGIAWPGKIEVISQRDQTYPDFGQTL